jgi:hypothetical protein
MEKFSPFQKIVGKDISEKQRNGVLECGEDTFNNQKFKGLEKEKEKTAEELEMIDIANKETNKIRQKYGLSDFNVPAKNIHIIDEQDWDKNYPSALYRPLDQAIVAFELKDAPEKIWLMRKIFHEMLHFKSYNAFQLVDSEDGDVKEICPYRCGLSVCTRDGKGEFLNSINEAVTEEMTKRFIKGLSENHMFREEIIETKGIIAKYTDMNTFSDKELSDDVVCAKVENTEIDGKKCTKVLSHSFSYENERKNLNTLITKLFDRNSDNFKSKEQIFDIFERGVITGNLLPVAKLIDNTFGEGALRQIGKLDDYIEEQEYFIDSL